MTYSMDDPHENPVPNTETKCFYCKVELDYNVPYGDPRRVESDHYISKHNGGSNGRENRVDSCVPCNRRKGKLNGDQFLKIMKEETEIHEPRIYTMPESFMYDQKVPARWRLLAVINGFHIAGLRFHASNEWIKAKLECSEQTVVNAVKELEQAGEIICIRTSTSRVIRRYDSSQLGSRLKPALVSDSSQLGTNSVSISDINPSVATAPPIVEVFEPEGETRPPSKKKYPSASVVFSWFPSRESSWSLNTTEMKHAELLFVRGERKVKSILAYVAKHREDDYFPKVNKPSDLERKWNDIIDYANKND